MKLTKWFDGRKFVPAHVGPYECADGFYRFWNGKFWGLLAHSADNADFFADEKSASQNHRLARLSGATKMTTGQSLGFFALCYFCGCLMFPAFNFYKSTVLRLFVVMVCAVFLIVVYGCLATDNGALKPACEVTK